MSGERPTLRIHDRAALLGSARHVHHPNYETVRVLSAQDCAGVGLTDVTLVPGVEDAYGHPDRTEIAYCLEGRARIRDLATGQAHDIVPGVLRVAPPGSRFSFLAEVPTRLVCIFDPPLEGHETGLVDPDV